MNNKYSSLPPFNNFNKLNNQAASEAQPPLGGNRN